MRLQWELGCSYSLDLSSIYTDDNSVDIVTTIAIGSMKKKLEIFF